MCRKLANITNRPEGLKDKNVVVMGIGNTACDTVVVSVRHGQLIRLHFFNAITRNSQTTPRKYICHTDEVRK